MAMKTEITDVPPYLENISRYLPFLPVISKEGFYMGTHLIDQLNNHRGDGRSCYREFLTSKTKIKTQVLEIRIGTMKVVTEHGIPIDGCAVITVQSQKGDVTKTIWFDSRIQQRDGATGSRKREDNTLTLDQLLCPVHSHAFTPELVQGKCVLTLASAQVKPIELYAFNRLDTHPHEAGAELQPDSKEFSDSYSVGMHVNFTDLVTEAYPTGPWLLHPTDLFVQYSKAENVFVCQMQVFHGEEILSFLDDAMVYAGLMADLGTMHHLNEITMCVQTHGLKETKDRLSWIKRHIERTVFNKTF